MTTKTASLCLSAIVIVCCALGFFLFASARPAAPSAPAAVAASETQRQTPEAPVSAPTREPEPRRDPDQDVAEIAQSISRRAGALSTLDHTRDVSSVLSLYDPEFVGIDNGEVADYETVETNLRSRARIPPPNSIVPPEAKDTVPTHYQARHVAVAAQGDSAWAVYQWTWSNDSSREMVSGAELCSSIFRRSVDGGWKLLHEHCSSPRESMDEKQQRMVLETLLRLAVMR